MVKLAFIGEGATEKIILESSEFRKYLRSIKIDFIEQVIDATGNGNLLPKNIAGFVSRLKDLGANVIFILTDLDEDKCITLTKDRIDPKAQHIIIVSVKEIESWFLAETECMSKFFGDSNFICDEPEKFDDPFSEIKALRLQKSGRGIATKRTLANLLVHKFGFSISRAANHANCSSAKYFINKMKSISTE